MFRRLGGTGGSLPGRGVEHRLFLRRLSADQAPLPQARGGVGGDHNGSWFLACDQPVHAAQQPVSIPYRLDQQRRADSSMSRLVSVVRFFGAGRQMKGAMRRQRRQRNVDWARFVGTSTTPTPRRGSTSARTGGAGRRSTGQLLYVTQEYRSVLHV